MMVRKGLSLFYFQNMASLHWKIIHAEKDNVQKVFQMTGLLKILIKVTLTWKSLIKQLIFFIFKKSSLIIFRDGLN